MITTELIQQLCALIDEGQLTSRSRELSRHAIEKLAERLTSERKEMIELLKDIYNYKYDVFNDKIATLLNRIDQ